MIAKSNAARKRDLFEIERVSMIKPSLRLWPWYYRPRCPWGHCRSNARFDTNSVIDRGRNSLLAGKVAFRRLNRDLAQKELDLLQFSSRRVAESGQVLRRSCGASFSSPIHVGRRYG